MTDAEYELARLKEAIAKRLDWEKLWEEQTERAEAAERERDELREALAKIASQKLVAEGGDGDFVDGYEACVKRARAAMEAKP